MQGCGTLEKDVILPVEQLRTTHDERSLLKTFYLKYVCNLAAVAWPAAAISRAQDASREAHRADSRHPERKRGKPFSHTIIDGEPLKCFAIIGSISMAIYYYRNGFTE